MKETLRQRWHSSINCLANELHSQSLQSHPKQSPSQLDDDAVAITSDAISSLSNKWLDKVALLYDEPHRAYHNMSHIEDVLASLDFLLGTRPEPTVSHSTLSPSICDDSDMAIAALAAFFHDVIYNPKSSTNEKDSADLFLEFASELYNIIIPSSLEQSNNADNTIVGNDEKQQSSTNTPATMQSEMISQIEQCIIATATHISSANQARESNNTLVATFLDADMSILGRDADRYDQYAGSIRKEYEFVERSMYCEKRAEILVSFLPAMDAAESVGGIPNDETNTLPSSESSREGKQHLFIYATEKGRELWEDQARRNLKREIDMLRRGTIPCEEDS